MTYLVRCVACDQAFWGDSRDAATPSHTRWDRRTSAIPVGDRCEGSGRAGHWVVESLAPLPSVMFALGNWR